MKKNIQFLVATNIILIFMILPFDFQYMTKFLLWFIWASWTSLVSIMYAIIWRESVDCRCLEKEKEQSKEMIQNDLESDTYDPYKEKEQ